MLMRTTLAIALSAATSAFLAAGASAATAPTISTSAATSVGPTTAQLNGSVNPNGATTSWYFEYGTSTSYGTKTPSHSVGSGTTPVGVFAPISGLQTGRTYHFRLVATSDGGTSLGADATFATGAGAPTVTTQSATSVSVSSATLQGSVNPNGEPTSWYFEYGTSTSYGTKTSVRSGGSGTRATNVSVSVSGLAAGATYHFRLVASNSTGTTTGNDVSFTTAGPPAVSTGAAQGVAVSSATLTGSVNPLGRGTTWHFDYGTSTSYGSRTGNQNAGSGGAVVNVSTAVSGLAPSTTYHFRLVASSSAGTSTGPDQSFTTLTAVTISHASLRVIAGRYGVISGTVTGGQTGVSVTILAQPFGQSAFAPVATVFTGANGAWTYNAKPTIRTDYQASANGGTSTAATIGVQPAVSLRLTSGGRFSTHASAGSTSFAGKQVQFQRMSGSRWVTVKRQRLNGNSTAFFPASLLPKGRQTVRVAMSVNQAGPGYLGGFSRQLHYRRA
jgi:hypothetical protein